MSFFDESAHKRAELALNRTYKNFENAGKYAYQHPVEASLIIGSLVAVAVYFPVPVIIALCISALLLISFNLFKDPTPGEKASDLWQAITA